MLGGLFTRKFEGENFAERGDGVKVREKSIYMESYVIYVKGQVSEIVV